MCVSDLYLADEVRVTAGGCVTNCAHEPGVCVRLFVSESLNMCACVTMCLSKHVFAAG